MKGGRGWWGEEEDFEQDRTDDCMNERRLKQDPYVWAGLFWYMVGEIQIKPLEALPASAAKVAMDRLHTAAVAQVYAFPIPPLSPRPRSPSRTR